MKLNTSIRVLLIILLTIVGVAVFFSFTKALTFIYSPLFFLFALGGIALLAFILITAQDLGKNKPIAREAYVISIALSIVVVVMLVLFGYGLVKDISGQHCSGFFGASASCTLTPSLILHLFILHPITLAFAGMIAAYGTYMQILTQKSKKRTSNLRKPK